MVSEITNVRHVLLTQQSQEEDMLSPLLFLLAFFKVKNYEGVTERIGIERDILVYRQR